MNDVRTAVSKVGSLLMATGWQLKRMAKSKDNLTSNELADIHDTLIYCAEAISQIAQAMHEEDSREKHG